MNSDEMTYQVNDIFFCNYSQPLKLDVKMEVAMKESVNGVIILCANIMNYEKICIFA